MTARTERRQSGRRLLSLVGVVLTVAVVVLVLGGLGWYVQHERNRARELRLSAQLAQAVACQERQEYVCARDGFSALLEEERDHAEARQRLQAVRLAIARQYATAGRWELAVAELDTLLTDTPTDREALELLRNVYDRWLTDAIGRGDLVTMFKVRWQRDARFPPLGQPTSLPSPTSGG